MIFDAVNRICVVSSIYLTKKEMQHIERSQVMDQFRLYWFKGMSVTATLHIFLNQVSKMCETSSPKGNDAHLRALGSRYYACP